VLIFYDVTLVSKKKNPAKKMTIIHLQATNEAAVRYSAGKNEANAHVS